MDIFQKIENEEGDVILREISSIMEKSYQIANTYVLHSGRKSILPKDMTNTYKFCCFRRNFDISNVEIIENLPSVEIECTCSFCQDFDYVINVWDYWEPSGIEKILKKIIDSVEKE